MQSLGSRESFLVQNAPMSTPPKFCKASGCLNPSIFIYLLGNSDLEAQWSQDIWGHCPGGAQVGFVPLTIPSPPRSEDSDWASRAMGRAVKSPDRFTQHLDRVTVIPEI